MNFRKMNKKASFYSFRDVPKGPFNSQREFSGAFTCWVNLKPVAPFRLIEDQNALGAENTVTHTATTRHFDHDQFTMALICGKWYRVQNRVDSKDEKFLVLGLVYISECTLEELKAPAFLEEAME